MTSDRFAAHAPRSQALSMELATLQGPCIGCTGCQGVCAALIQAMTLPEIILRDRSA